MDGYSSSSSNSLNEFVSVELVISYDCIVDIAAARATMGSEPGIITSHRLATRCY